MISRTERVKRIARTKLLREAFRELLETPAGPKFIEEVLTDHPDGPSIAGAVLRACRHGMTEEELLVYFGKAFPSEMPEGFIEQLRTFRERLEQGIVDDEELRELWRELQNEPQEKH